MARLFFKPATIAVACAYFTGVTAQVAAYGQCGGQGYSGPTTCVVNWCCVYENPYYSNCLQYSGCPNTSSASVSGTATSTATTPTATLYPGLRTNVEPYEYLQSVNTNAAGALILGNSTTAGQFTLDSEQIRMWIPSSNTFLFCYAQPPANSSQTTLPATCSTTPNSYAYYGVLVDTYTVKGVVSATGQEITWIKCQDNFVYGNLASDTPAGCTPVSIVPTSY
ncbi:hypothetical protein FRB94_007942 [Tulasnella sp. JGI-2019a]|nr:hypothetical protein FRB94_007942 [Tulasnella sp. JGI-2019a]KAG9027795.1 hypothetical protein FRB95_007375 [Tulasnella sp. JGI-2019a]